MTTQKLWTVEEAAKILDGYDPTWFTRINTLILDLASYKTCVLGQSYGRPCDAERNADKIDEIHNLFGVESRFAGVEADNESSLFASNENLQAWKEAIKRRKEVKPVTATESLPENRTQPVLDSILKEIAKDICAGKPEKARELLVMLGYIKHVPERFEVVQ